MRTVLPKKSLRAGIDTFLGASGVLHRCKKHRRVWREGENFVRFGGAACEECVMKTLPKLRYA